MGDVVFHITSWWWKIISQIMFIFTALDKRKYLVMIFVKSAQKCSCNHSSELSH